MPTTDAEINRLLSDIHKLRADLEQMGTTLRRLTRAGVRDAGRRVRAARNGLGEDLHQTANCVTHSIADNAVIIALIAIGIGLALGDVWHRRRRCR
jgi:hypothetical protein